MQRATGTRLVAAPCASCIPLTSHVPPASITAILHTSPCITTKYTHRSAHGVIHFSPRRCRHTLLHGRTTLSEPAQIRLICCFYCSSSFCCFTCPSPPTHFCRERHDGALLHTCRRITTTALPFAVVTRGNGATARDGLVRTQLAQHTQRNESRCSCRLHACIMRSTARTHLTLDR